MADFQKSIGEFTARNAAVVAASVDGLEDARKTIARHGLTFPVAFGLEARDVSAKTGAFFQKERGSLHATGFIIRRDGTLAHAVYSTGAIGRLVAADCIEVIDYYARKPWVRTT